MPGYAFLIGAAEGQKEEKRRFFSAEIARLRARGMPADIFEGDEPLPEDIRRARIHVGDVLHLMHRASAEDGGGDGTGAAGAPVHMPMVWNPYSFFGQAHDWVRTAGTVPGLLAPGAGAAGALRKYRLGKPVGALEVAIDYQWTEQESADLPRDMESGIGYLAEQWRLAHFVRGCLLRLNPGLRMGEWVKLDFERPEDWRRDLPRVSALFSLRLLCGSAVPLLDAMALGVPVIGAHGGGLKDIAGPENGCWVDSATPDAFVAPLAAALEHFSREPGARASLVAAACTAARTAGAEARADNNQGVWYGVEELVRSRRQQGGGSPGGA